MLSRNALTVVIVLLASAALAQDMSKLDRGRAQDILQGVSDEVRKHYYDPKYHGVDWDAKVAEAKKKINDAKSFNVAMSSIAAMLASLDDSHTFFIPPQHAYRYDFGWQYKMIGDHCFVTRVRPGSDAESKGVKPGDEVLTINGFTPYRDSIFTMHYVFTALRPQTTFQVSLRDPAGNQRQVELAAKIREIKRVTDLTGANDASDLWNLLREEEVGEHLGRARWVEYGDDLIILKFPEFDFGPVEVADMIAKARKHKALIVDLRGNPGGSTDMLERFVGGFFEKDVTIGNRTGRKSMSPIVAKGSHNPFTGKLVVLVDSESGSASELFARVMQIEKRGVVMGDRSSGLVMEARRYDEKIGTDINIFYAVSVTDANITMGDGKSLEHTGVTPDELLLPSPSALANHRDPVLARAAESLGIKLTSEDAGKLFPYEWPPQ